MVHGLLVHGLLVHGLLVHGLLVHGLLVHGLLVHGLLVHGPVVHGAGPLAQVDRASGLIHDVWSYPPSRTVASSRRPGSGHVRRTERARGPPPGR